MSERAVRFKQSDVTRAIRGAVKAGFRVGGFEIDPNGKVGYTKGGLWAWQMLPDKMPAAAPAIGMQMGMIA